jgi:hypothetical protein
MKYHVALLADCNDLMARHVLHAADEVTLAHELDRVVRQLAAKMAKLEGRLTSGATGSQGSGPAQLWRILEETRCVRDDGSIALDVCVTLLRA